MQWIISSHNLLGIWSIIQITIVVYRSVMRKILNMLTVLATHVLDAKRTFGHIKGKFDWGFWYVIIFLYVQFWIRLAAVSYPGKNVRTVASPVVRSVNKSRDTRHCVQNEPEYSICVIFTILLYYKALGLILCDLVWHIRHNYKRPDDGHGDVTGHRKMSELRAVGPMVTTHGNFVMVWLFKGPNLFCVL